MTVIISPLVFLTITLGKTVDLRNYGMPFLPSIFDDTEAVETPVNLLNSTYHVLQDGMFPYSRFGVPIDLVFKIGSNTYGTIVSNFNKMNSDSFENVPVLFVSEYRTIDRSVKDNATPIPGWQVQSRKSSTHYAHTMHYGGRCYVLTNIRSNVTGDIQVIRRLLADAMGSSGRIGADTKDLWRNTVKTIKESEDVRGEVRISTTLTATEAADMPNFNGIEDLLEKMNEFSKYVIPPNPERNNVPLYVSLRPLHDLDEQYDAIRKNVLSESYMLKLKQKQNDVEFTYRKVDSLYDKMPEDDFEDYHNKLSSVRKSLKKLSYTPLSIYKDIDVEAFKRAFGIYQNGLDNSTENYLTDYKRVYEEADINCENNFLKPTRGSLIVNEHEVVKKGRTGDLAECQDLCVQDIRCRAVGYSEDDKECLIYYRSTRSARILFPRSSIDSKIYDRKCE